MDAALLSVAAAGFINDQFGSPIENISFTGLPSEVKTSADGSYQVELAAGWSGIITPVSEKYVFAPAFITINNISSPLSDRNFTASIVTGVDDEEKLFNVYPNPSIDGRIQIVSNQECKLYISTSTGLIIGSGSSTTFNQFQLPSPGVYIIRRITHNTENTTKVVFQ